MKMHSFNHSVNLLQALIERYQNR